MTTVVAEPIFLDTNILVYASVDSSPFYDLARTTITAYEQAGTPLWISRQVLREYLATLIRPNVGLPITELTATVRRYELRFQVVEESPLVTAQLLALLEQSRSRQVHDTNIVATMQTIGITHILTNNPDDFAPFSTFITVIPLVSFTAQQAGSE
ncbi:MAG: PIN domain-containing protein [Chloroflexia bacterium]|nr:PIN domain-containing protein [Chloroflexia bacterium]